ncbi:ABC transporter substrate-binding protein [Aquamicrobium zhengzhouense]|uniref:ABC transporter substrate-binding protein n=1 Tax=Aquamicrobium zhengzhouense TaxID=2781738 RepID=A0ABS0SEJ1_9HYPH|nr:ABC transporter substrate-binding protein [Aquamicrobium zhengzhouense]MBI1621646.1 ABC transporter substrate-binding protein [Aquamicrobium zhengzhouense]
MLITRRQSLGLLGGAAAGALILPHRLMAQGARRSITIAVQKISNNNTLDNWHEQSNVGERVFYPNFWEGLIGRNWMGDQGPVPELATEWKRLDDKTIEFKLRQGVKFHNGDEMTAEDVAFSFSDERLFGGTEPVGGTTIYAEDFKPKTDKELPASVPGTARRLWPALRGVEIVDRYTVRFHNATPDVTLEGRFYAGGPQITSKRAWDEAKTYAEWARSPVTTGAYKVEEFKPDVSLTLVAHDEHWAGRPPLERIRFVEVPEVASRVNGLLSGEYDFACDLPPDQIGTIANTAGLEVQSSTIWNHRVSVFNAQNEIMADPLVRRAMTHAIDRNAIVEALWAGQTVVPRGLQFDSYAASNMLIEDWTVPEYNPELARDLLKQANYKGDPIPYFLLNNYYTNQTATGQVLTEMWQQAGINIEIQMKENWSQIFAGEGERGLRDWSASNLVNDPVTPMVNQFGPNGQAQQNLEYSNAELNQMSVVLETSTDHETRRKAFRRMLEIAEREDPVYTLLHQNAVFTGMKSELNWKAAPAFAMDFRRDNWNV